jgi:leucyl aminopeptidase
MTPIHVSAGAAKPGADAQIVVVGHAALPSGKAVASCAAALAKGDLKSPQVVRSDAGVTILLQPEHKPWLTGHDEWRILGRQAVDSLRGAACRTAVVVCSADDARVAALVEGLLLADYRLTTCRSGKAAKPEELQVRIPGRAAAVSRGVEVATAQNLARELADLPANLLHPRSFVERAQKLLRGSGVTVTVISGVAALRRAGYPGVAQVGMAGAEPPAVLRMAWRPKATAKTKTRAKGDKPVHLALVGKGITFDTGGISLKPGADMWEMKYDMTGAADVLAAMTVVAARKPGIAVTGWCALAENLPDSSAQRPGDIYRTRKGLHVMVDNTDAEGRLVLADVLTAACEDGATHLLDAATLTGACMVALGNGVAGLMGNHDGWIQEVRAAGREVGEECWPMPLFGEYRQNLDHPHADLSNMGGRYGGSLIAGLFLQEFVDPAVQWAHLDIAGPAMRTGGGWRAYGKGGTGFGTRTMIRVVERLAGG